jgi:hypothetical protein
MTTPESELNRSNATAHPAGTAESAAPRGYAVGHGKPPLEHRFKKGNRANPGGKKRKVRSSAEVVPRLPAESVHEMLMAEAMRMVRVKAGGRFVEIPAMQAAFREIAMKAARGNRLATATLARLVVQSEATERGGAVRAAVAAPGATPPRVPSADAPRISAGEPAGHERSGHEGPGLVQSRLDAAVEYKAVWTRILTEAATLDAEIAAPKPHPDDVAIGRVRHTANWPGAAEGAILELDPLAALHARLQKEWPARRPGIEALPDGYDKAVAWCEWFAVDDARVLIARHLPQRYAGQIKPDERSPAEVFRDQNLRTMAAYDRELHEGQRASEAASKARNAAREAGELPGRVHEGGRDEGVFDEDGEENERVERAPPAVKPLVGSTSSGPPRAVVEARVYCAAWREMLWTAGKLGWKLKSVPKPDDVMIDEDMMISYRVPTNPDKRATLVNLRETLAKMRRVAAGYSTTVARATDPDDAGVARCQRDIWLSLIAIIERHLEGVRAGFG